jgi:hypothetical protein
MFPSNPFLNFKSVDFVYFVVIVVEMPMKVEVYFLLLYFGWTSVLVSIMNSSPVSNEPMDIYTLY